MIFPSFEHAIDGTERGGRGKGARDWNTSGLREKNTDGMLNNLRILFMQSNFTQTSVAVTCMERRRREKKMQDPEAAKREIRETRGSDQISVGKERGIFCPLSLQGNPSRIIIIIYAFRCLAPSCKIGERTGE